MHRRWARIAKTASSRSREAPVLQRSLQPALQGAFCVERLPRSSPGKVDFSGVFIRNELQPKGMNTPSTPEQPWIHLARSPEYRELLASKRRFIVPATLFFVIYYFSLLVLVGWFPRLMSRPVFGVLNVAYVFAVSQFLMAWILAFVYVRKAAEWDRQSASLVNKAGGEVSAQKQSASSVAR